MPTVEQFETLASRTFNFLSELGFPMPDLEDAEDKVRRKWVALLAKEVNAAKAEAGPDQPDFTKVADHILHTLSQSGFRMPDLDGKGPAERTWAIDALANILSGELGYDETAY